MSRFPGPMDAPLLVVVGSGGVGKTTLAAALGLQSAKGGARTLVMTFDPSLRLKDALGVGESARDAPVAVPGAPNLDAALLDAKRTFDRLVQTYAPDEAAAQRIFTNRFYRDLAGSLAGILEYMAMERLFEVRASGGYDRIVLDTPPTRQALDFLEAPDRIVAFLDSKAVQLALAPWWEGGGGSRGLAARITAKGAEELADRIIGRRFLMDLVEFLRAFAPLFQGFRERAEAVRALLKAQETRFVLVTGPGSDRIPDTLFFLRRLREAGHRVGPVVVNQVHPFVPDGPRAAEGLRLLQFLGARDQEGLAELRARFPQDDPVVALPLLAEPPNGLAALDQVGAELLRLMGEQEAG